MRNSIGALIISISQILATTAEATIHDIMVSNNTNARVHISWITNDTTTGEVHYSHNPDLSSPSTAYDTRGQSFEGCTHYVEIKNLAKETTYYFKVRSSDVEDNEAVSEEVETFTTSSPADTIAPVISDIAVSDINESSITISWVTDEPASSQLLYYCT